MFTYVILEFRGVCSHLLKILLYLISYNEAKQMDW